eukprot:scaffold78054_cov35-Tisochrysis_lutea.AAC.1
MPHVSLDHLHRYDPFLSPTVLGQLAGSSCADSSSRMSLRTGVGRLLPLRRALEVASDVASALVYLHPRVLVSASLLASLRGNMFVASALVYLFMWVIFLPASMHTRPRVLVSAHQFAFMHAGGIPRRGSHACACLRACLSACGPCVYLPFHLHFIGSENVDRWQPAGECLVRSKTHEKVEEKRVRSRLFRKLLHLEQGNRNEHDAFAAWFATAADVGCT